MSEKVRKHKERASRLIAKGKYEDALEEYQKAVKLAPRDLTLRQRLAEAYARLGKTEKAVREYQAVAGSYAADGLLLKAIAICKVILQIDPSHKETQMTLAELYAQKRGNFSSSSVTLPNSMSGALGNREGKRSASEIRGIPASKLGPNTPVVPFEAARVVSPRPPPAAPAEDLYEVEEDRVEVVSVEPENAPVEPLVLGAPVQTNVADLVSLIGTDGKGAPVPAATSGDAIPITSTDAIEVVVEEASPVVVGAAEPPVVVGTPAPLPDDEEIFEDTDDGELRELDEPVEAEVNAEKLPPIPLFSDLPKEAFIALTERMDLVEAEPGEVLIVEGEYASSMFIVIQGRVKVVREVAGGKEIKLAELGDGSFFGEMALLSDAPRTASVIAVEDTMLFEISREIVDEITREYPSVEQVMKRFYRNRLLTNLLKTSPIFAPFSPKDKKDLIEKFKSRSVEPGKILITRDQPGDGLYVLLSGRCEVVSKDDAGREVVIAELRDGDVFGEMSMLFRKKTVASVRTITPCIVLRLPRQRFDELIMTHPQVLEALAELSEQRTRYNQELFGSEEDVLRDFLV